MLIKSVMASASRKSFGSKSKTTHYSSPEDDYYSTDFGEDNTDHNNSPSINRQRWNGQYIGSEWICDECEYSNLGADAICRSCRQGKRSNSKTTTSARPARKIPQRVICPSATSSPSRKHDYDRNLLADYHHPHANAQYADNADNRPTNDRARLRRRQTICVRQFQEHSYANQSESTPYDYYQQDKRNEDMVATRQSRRDFPPISQVIQQPDDSQYTYHRSYSYHSYHGLRRSRSQPNFKSKRFIRSKSSCVRPAPFESADFQHLPSNPKSSMFQERIRVTVNVVLEIIILFLIFRSHEQTKICKFHLNSTRL